MKVLVNYANETYKKAQIFSSKMGIKKGGFDKVFSFGPEDIDMEYRKAHKNIFEIKRGDGLWLWKPYLINRVLEKTKDGDYIFYCDSGAFFVKNVDNIIQSLRPNEKIWVSDNPLIESCFTKEGCFEAMNCLTAEYKYTNQIQATYIMFVNCKETREFVKKWMSLCEQYRLISPENAVIDYTLKYGMKFVSHREDQSILSLLCKLEGVYPHLDPSQRAIFPETFFNPCYAYKVPAHNDQYRFVIFLHKAKVVNCYEILKVAYGTLKKIAIYKKWKSKELKR